MAYYDNGILGTARGLLNAFGFALQDGCGEEREIYIKRDRRARQAEEDKSVGKLHVNILHDINGNLFSNSGYLYAKFGTGILTAQIRSREFIERIYKLRNTVTFEFSKDGKKINGQMVVKISPEGYYSCSANMTCLNEKDGKESTMVLNNGDELFNATIKDNTSIEDVKMVFFGPNKQGVWHTRLSDYNKSTNEYLSSEKIEVTGYERSSDSVIINKESITREGGKPITTPSNRKEAKPDIRGLDKKRALSKRMFSAGRMLYNEDLKIGDCIHYLFDRTFIVGNNRVGENIAVMCYEYYDERAIDSLLGIYSDKSFYQGKGEISFEENSIQSAK